AARRSFRGALRAPRVPSVDLDRARRVHVGRRRALAILLPGNDSMDRLKNPRLLLALLVLVLAAIVFFQNRAEIDIDVLFLGTLHTAKSTALILAFAAGALFGAMAFSRWQSQWRKQKEKEKEKEKEQKEKAAAS